ncbi:MAG: putative transport system permease protein [Frankiaceae bacterium]|nr:putative transport system permease protein [Frankiaceae bacterium]
MNPLTLVWATLRRRLPETIAAALAVGLVVSYLAAVGSFISATRADLSVRAAARVPVDWQVQVTPAGSVADVTAALRSIPGVAGIASVDLAVVPGLTSTTAGATRTTGRAYVVGLPPDYAAFAPRELKALLGSRSGIRLQQQTAANLAATVGDSVAVVGGAKLTVAGIVDLPAADSFFQVVGAPAGSGASAPPDNVLIVPSADFARVTAGRAVVHQLHVRFNHSALPHDPDQASVLVTQRANNFAVKVAGAALVGDNLGAALSAAREDALYARLLVLLLGAPGVVLAGIVTALVVALRTDRQRRELGILRLRGATPARAAVLVGSPALLDGALGAGLGVAGAYAVTRLALGRHVPVDGVWLTGAVALGFALALLTELWPVARLLRRSDPPSISDTTTALPTTRQPLALRLGLDVVLLGVAGLVLYLSSRNGYKVVVVPEGLPVASVDYAALLAPAFAWPGLGLLLWRVTASVLKRGRRRPKRDPSGRVPDLRAATVRRRRRLIARGATGLGLAIGVAVSTSVFTATYDKQARIDVALTVGSDAAVTVPPDTVTPGLDAARVAKVSGVKHVEPMLHRLTYVGPDLQDLYGVNAATIGQAAPLLNAFTPGSSVHQVLTKLGATRDGALVSQETLHDYQLRPGDLIRLRLRDTAGTYRAVPFHVVGVVTEFATAPRDSFVVANASYVAQVTGRSAPETLLVRTDHPKKVGAALRHLLAQPGVTVSDTATETAAVTTASGLAATDLSGLSRLGIGFGVLLALASAVLALVVGAAQRTRSLVALGVLGASARQRASFLWSEARALVVAGVAGGIGIGTAIAYTLVKVLTGIFDPAPEHITVPWTYLASLVAGVCTASALAVYACGRWAGRLEPARLRDL